MREFRRALTGLAPQHALRYRREGLLAFFVTLIWTDPQLRGPQLPDVKLTNLGQRLRMSLRRCGLNHVPVIGGFEIDWSDSAKVWELHGHFVAFIEREGELDPLRSHFQKAHGVSRPMQVEAVDWLNRAIPYCWKFSPMRKVTYKRDG